MDNKIHQHELCFGCDYYKTNNCMIARDGRHRCPIFGTLVPPKKYLNVSVCVKHFYEMADMWWFMYESFSRSSYKEVCLQEYCKWTKYAKIFGKG